MVQDLKRRHKSQMCKGQIEACVVEQSGRKGRFPHEANGMANVRPSIVIVQKR